MYLIAVLGASAPFRGRPAPSFFASPNAKTDGGGEPNMLSLAFIHGKHADPEPNGLCYAPPLPVEDAMPPWRTGKFSYYANQQMFSPLKPLSRTLSGPRQRIYRNEL